MIFKIRIPSIPAMRTDITKNWEGGEEGFPERRSHGGKIVDNATTGNKEPLGLQRKEDKVPFAVDTRRIPGEVILVSGHLTTKHIDAGITVGEDPVFNFIRKLSNIEEVFVRIPYITHTNEVSGGTRDVARASSFSCWLRTRARWRTPRVTGSRCLSEELAPLLWSHMADV